MKKITVFTLLALLTVGTFAQKAKDSTTKKKGYDSAFMQSFLHDSAIIICYMPKMSDTMELTGEYFKRMKYMVVDSVLVTTAEIKNYVHNIRQNNVPFYIPLQGINFIDYIIQKAPNPGLTGEQMDYIKQYMKPYTDYIKQLNKPK